MRPLLRSFGRFFQRNRASLCIMFCMALTMTVVSMYTGQWLWRRNWYNSYTLQALAWLDGRLDLADGPSRTWLELAIYDGKYYVSFPPFPSYVMLPFALLFGENTPDAWIALFFAMLSCVYAVRIYREVTHREDGLYAMVLYLLLANGYVYLTVNGWVWFIAQNMCFALSLMAIFYALAGRGGVSLTCWACAVGCRPMVVVYLPLLVYLICRRWKQLRPDWSLLKLIAKKWYWAIGPLLVAASYMTLNYLRFGSVVEFGHNYLPEFSREGATPQFSWGSFWPNLKLYLRLPQWKGDSGIGFYALQGNAFYLVNPIILTTFASLLWAMGSALHRRLTHQPGPRRPEAVRWPVMVMVPLLAAVHIVWICCHATLGAVQFGNRYLVDTFPWLYLGFLWWMPRDERFTRWHLPLLCYGTCVNVVGAIFSYNNLL